MFVYLLKASIILLFVCIVNLSVIMGSRRQFISAKGSNGENCTAQQALVEVNFPCKRLSWRVVVPLPREELKKTRLLSIFVIFVRFRYYCTSKSFNCAHCSQIFEKIFKIEYPWLQWTKLRRVSWIKNIPSTTDPAIHHMAQFANVKPNFCLF